MHQKDHPPSPWLSRLHSRAAGIVQHTKFCQYNPPYKANERKKNYVTIALDAEKVIDKILHFFITNDLEKSETQGAYLDITKAILNKPKVLSD